MSAQSLISQGYGGYAGWGDAEADADFKATGGSGKKTSGSTGGSGSASIPQFDDSAFKLAFEMQKQAVEPVVSALGAQKSVIPQTFATTQKNLEDTSLSVTQRYDNLLASLTAQKQSDVASVGLNTSREFGKRGVPLSSGVYDQALEEKTQPINQFYAGQGKDVELQKNADLLSLAAKINGLPSEQRQALMDIDLAIAEAKANNSEKAIQILQTLGGATNQANQFAATMAQNANQFASSQSQSASQFSQNLQLSQAELAEKQRQFNAEQSRLKTSGSTTLVKESADQTARNEVLSGGKSGWSLESLVRVYGAQLGVDQVVKLAAGVGVPITADWAKKILGTYSVQNPTGEIDIITGLPK